MTRTGLGPSLLLITGAIARRAGNREDSNGADRLDRAPAAHTRLREAVPRRSPGFNSPKAPNNLANACYLESIEAINETRNKAAHGGDTAKVLYQGRNPFRDPDAFAQMYFDVWAIKQSISKFFERAITYPKEKLLRYYEKYGDI
jgi:hypothetical protein